MDLLWKVDMSYVENIIISEHRFVRGFFMIHFSKVHIGNVINIIANCIDTKLGFFPLIFTIIKSSVD